MDIKKLNAFLPSSSVEEATSTEASSKTSADKKIGPGISSEKDSLEAVQHSASAFENNDASDLAGIDPNSLVQYVLRESYVQSTEDLRFYAEKVKYFNEAKKEVRDYLEKMRDADSNLKRDFGALQPGRVGDAIQIVMQTIKQSLEENNETKKYYLDLLDGMNKTNHFIAASDQRMIDASTKLAAKEKDDDDDD